MLRQRFVAVIALLAFTARCQCGNCRNSRLATIGLGYDTLPFRTRPPKSWLGFLDSPAPVLFRIAMFTCWAFTDNARSFGRQAQTGKLSSASGKRRARPLPCPIASSAPMHSLVWFVPALCSSCASVLVIACQPTYLPARRSHR